MIKTLKQTIQNLYYWIKKKLIRFKKWIILIIFGSAVLAAPLILPVEVPDIALEKIQQKYEASELKDKYRLEKTAFILDAVDENAIQAEVGNKNSEEFTPELTLRKWDDEVNFKVKYKNNEKKPKVDLEDNKIKWKGNKTEVHYYEMKKGEVLLGKVLESDVYEVEVLLLEKPDTNIVEFDIETKGLSFYYQPELTQEEKDEGAFRPENVIGSYAVYHESKQGDYSKMGKKNYRAGKAFHIYRPKIIDSAGKEVWGKLNITDNLLTVEIPQEFLDNAVYPVRHAAGLTFGYDTIGGSTDYWNGSLLSKATSAPEFNGSLDSLTIYAYYNNNPADFNPALYSDESGTPTTRLAYINSGGTAFGSSFSWVTTALSYADITAETQYWLGHKQPADDIYTIRFKYDTVTGELKINGAVFDWETPFSVSSTFNQRVSIYCTYTAGEEEARRMFLIE